MRRRGATRRRASTCSSSPTSSRSSGWRPSFRTRRRPSGTIGLVVALPSRRQLARVGGLLIPWGVGLFLVFVAIDELCDADFLGASRCSAGVLGAIQGAALRWRRRRPVRDDGRRPRRGPRVSAHRPRDRPADRRVLRGWLVGGGAAAAGVAARAGRPGGAVGDELRHGYRPGTPSSRSASRSAPGRWARRRGTGTSRSARRRDGP